VNDKAISIERNLDNIKQLLNKKYCTLRTLRHPGLTLAFSTERLKIPFLKTMDNGIGFENALGNCLC